MARIHAINAQRIIWCCDDFGITTDQLAIDIGLAPATLQKVLDEEYESALSFLQLRRLAAYFGRGVLFFLEQAPAVADEVHTLAFRTLANQKPELSPKLRLFIERVEQQRSYYVSLREELEDADLPQFIPPFLPGNSSKHAASIARGWLGLKAVNTFETYRQAVEAKGILVFRSNGYNGKWQISSDSPILGFTLYDEQFPVIVVKKLRTDAQLTFTLMHELGHLLLHRTSSIDDEGDMHSHQGDERDANAFAGHLLVPDDFLATIDDTRRPMDVVDYDEWLDAKRKAWGVSTEVILRRLLDSGRLTQARYHAYREWRNGLVYPEGAGTRLYRHREPRSIFGDTFVRVVLGALNARRITLTKASKYLDGLKVKDLHALERHYASL
jgi:Zn-dependent peptidase ImmA (M78 family)